MDMQTLRGRLSLCERILGMVATYIHLLHY